MHMANRIADDDLTTSWEREQRLDRDFEQEPRPAPRRSARPRYFTTLDTPAATDDQNRGAA